MTALKALAIAVGISYFGFVFAKPPMERNSTAQETGEITMRMERVCAESYKVVDGALEEECGQLIDQVQARGYNVYSKDGVFQAELDF